MESTYLTIIAILLVIILLLLRSRNRQYDQQNSSNFSNPAHPPYPPQGGSIEDIKLDPELKARMLELLAANQKIKAIKELRLATNWGLKEAKDYVDYLDNQRN